MSNHEKKTIEDIKRECEDYALQEAHRLREQNPDADPDELVERVMANALARYGVALGLDPGLRPVEAIYPEDTLVQSVYGTAAPSDIGEADVDVAVRWTEENVPDVKQVIDVEYAGEVDGSPVYRVIYEM